MSLKKFEILEMVAKGGMAEVYRAKTTGLQGFEKEVCVKKILPHLTEDEAFVTMFVNEAKLAATLTYANIVQVQDLCVSANGEYFIVMEYVRGKDLSDVIRTAQLNGQNVPPEIAVAVCRELLKGLHYAHTKTDVSGAPLHIIHRDISPHNILVSFMGEVKIADFGIAKASSIATKTAVGILKGKYGYMSPEQARGQPLDARSDVFNAGIVLYEILVGERCFAGSSDFSTLNLMRNAEVTPPTQINAKIPRSLETICLTALARAPQDRFQSAADFERALGDFAQSSGRVVTATDIVDFMGQLFGSTGKPAVAPTDVLALASVVGPAPSKPPAKKLGERHRTTDSLPRVRSSPRHGGSKAPPAASIPAATSASAEAMANAAPNANAAANAASSDRPASADIKRPDAKKAEIAPRPKDAASSSSGTPETPREAAPAREEAKPKGNGERAVSEHQSPSPHAKRPIGRKDLRPGLTRIQALEKRGRGSFWFLAFVIVTAAGAGGAVYGHMVASGHAEQSTFRQQEVEADSKPPPDIVTILIDSDPPGALVRFDDVELSSRTPVAVPRDRDDKQHTLEFSYDGFTKTRQTFTYGAGRVVRVHQRLEGESGRLAIDSVPKGLPIRVDGKDVGKTPFSASMPPGTYEVRIGGGPNEMVTARAHVKPGGTTTVRRAVPTKGAEASIRFVTDETADVFLDGEPTGRTTAERVPIVPDIDHRFSFRHGEKAVGQEIIVRAQSGEAKTVYVRRLD